jgi:CelD/BcsL family acetyltransferase involved in cellulose biosynthesis
LSSGYESYYQNHLKLSRRELPVARQKLRNAERAFGPIEFSWRGCTGLLPLLMEWKLAQCRRASRYSALSEAWAQKLVHRLMAHQEDGFSAVFSTLTFGGEPAAALFSLRSHATLHCCITAYNPAFASYSPGMQLMLKVIQAAASEGVTRVDLGRGTERYKQRLANQSQMVCEGCADLNPLTASLWRANLRLRRRLRMTALWPLIARVRMLAIPGR